MAYLVKILYLHLGLYTFSVYDTLIKLSKFPRHKVLRDLKASTLEEKKELQVNSREFTKKRAINTFSAQNKGKKTTTGCLPWSSRDTGFLSFSKERDLLFYTVTKEKISLQKKYCFSKSPLTATDRRKAKEPFQKFWLTLRWKNDKWLHLKRPKNRQTQRNHGNSKTNTNTAIQSTGNSAVNLRLAPLVIRWFSDGY